MTSYTLAISERNDNRVYYIGVDGKCYDNASRSKPLTIEEATWARDRLMDGCRKAKRPIKCNIMELSQ